MRSASLLFVLSLALPAGCADSQAMSGGGRVRAPFQASQVLPSGVLRGSNYTIDEPVMLDGFSYVFSLKTPYGVIPARGRNMLELRLREMHAIRAAVELSRRAHVVGGAMGSLEKAGDGLNHLLTDPGGTLMDAPRGMGEMINQLFDPADRRAGSEARRALAGSVGCDPETSNPVLKVLLDEMAIRRQLGGFVTGSAMDVVLPGMSLLSTSSDLRQVLRSMPPHVVNQQIERDLITFGISRGRAERFCRNKQYTTMQRLIFLRTVVWLRGAGNVDAVVDSALSARDEAAGLDAILETRLLAELHKSRPIAQLARAGVTVALFQDGSAVLVLVGDYLPGSDALRRVVADFRATYPRTPAALLTNARVSPEALQLLHGAGIVLSPGR